MNARVFKFAIGALACVEVTFAQDQPGAASANFTIAHQVTDAGGGRSTSAHFEIVSSLTLVGSLATAAPSTVVRSGFAGQLNESPTAVADSFTVPHGRPLKILKSTLLANDTDAESGLPHFVSIPSTSTQGIPLSIIGDWIVYDAGPGNTSGDSFAYTISDGIDQSTGAVNIAISDFNGITFNITLQSQSGNTLVRIYGIPGHPYQLQTTSDLAAPIVWTNLGTPTTAPTNGLIQRTDTAPPAPRFYRAIEP